MTELPFQKEHETLRQKRPYWMVGCILAWVILLLALGLLIGFGTYEQRTLFRWVGSLVLCLLFIFAYVLTFAFAFPRMQRRKSLEIRFNGPREEKSGIFLKAGKIITLSGQGKGRELFFQTEAGQALTVYWDIVNDPLPFETNVAYRFRLGQRFVLAYERIA